MPALSPNCLKTVASLTQEGEPLRASRTRPSLKDIQKLAGTPCKSASCFASLSALHTHTCTLQRRGRIQQEWFGEQSAWKTKPILFRRQGFVDSHVCQWRAPSPWLKCGSVFKRATLSCRTPQGQLIENGTMSMNRTEKGKYKIQRCLLSPACFTQAAFVGIMAPCNKNRHVEMASLNRRQACILAIWGGSQCPDRALDPWNPGNKLKQRLEAGFGTRSLGSMSPPHLS